MSERDQLRLADIADQLDYMVSALSGKSEAEFIADRTLHQAIALSLQIIGEASNNLSEEARSKAPDVPWAQIIALRHRIVHGYFSLELREIWRIATISAPDLRLSLREAGLLAPP